MGFIKRSRASGNAVFDNNMNAITEFRSPEAQASRAAKAKADEDAAKFAAGKPARDAAAQAATQAGLGAARNAAVSAASESLGVPMDNPDIQLSGTPADNTQDAGLAFRKRKQSVSDSGVNI